MRISTDQIQKYIHGTLDSNEASDLERLFNSDDSYKLLAKILKSCKKQFPLYKENGFSNISFDQIDNIILQCLTDKISSDNCNLLLSALNSEYDFLEKLITRIKCNVMTAAESENVALEGIEMFADDTLLEQMDIKPKPAQLLIEGLESKEPSRKSFIQKIEGFVNSLVIPKPAYYLVPIVLIGITVFVGQPVYSNWQSDKLTRQSLALLVENFEIADGTPRPTGGFDYQVWGMVRGGKEGTKLDIEKLLKEAIDLNKENVSAHLYLGTWFSFQKQYDKAKKQYEIALHLSPENAELFNELGQLEFIKGNLKEAEAYFLNTLEMDQQNLEARYNLGLVYSIMGMQTQAKIEWQKYLKTDSLSIWKDVVQDLLSEK
ncbi:MAG: hypothetical protein D8M58_18465 [Calditrichaeota bacterium]|nr:MAG: hypothetical protein DWQ03_11695 [Calditrichota bacterium]MBL1207394.1 hypothetical protein [Calditrichota bacterium]NOG47226.1 tetratricopeptide repeat protein [Calditrichota bacterium]